jgi:hypothetical protein
VRTKTLFNPLYALGLKLNANWGFATHPIAGFGFNSDQ